MKNIKPDQRLAQTIKKMDGAYAESTIRAYQEDFLSLIIFCNQRGNDALPISPTDLCAYIRHLSESGKSSATIRRCIAGFTTIHKLNYLPDPTKDPDVILEMKRMHRQIGRYSKQAYGITSDLLHQLLHVTKNDLRGSRDKALLLIAYDTLARRSELTSLRIEDIQYRKNKNTQEPTVLIRKSKTDQLAQGRRLALTQKSKKALDQWIKKLGNPKEGLIFRGVNCSNEITGALSGGQINKIYKKLARQAGLENDVVEKISGHSIRVGHAQDMVNSGESLPMIMVRGRWSKPDTVMRYVENVSLPCRN